MSIDFRPTEEQVMLRNVARSFATQVLQPLARELDALTDPWECFQRSKPAFTQMAAGGLTASLIPTEYGGTGSSCVSGWERKGAHLYTLTTRTDLSRGA